MKETDIKEIMQREISERLENPAWDLAVASGVMNEKRRSRRRIVYSSASLAFAALFMVVVMFGLRNEPEPTLYSSFITQQIEGTHSTSFEKNVLVAAAEKNEESLVFSNDMSSLIDDTLIMR